MMAKKSASRQAGNNTTAKSLALTRSFFLFACTTLSLSFFPALCGKKANALTCSKKEGCCACRVWWQC